MASQPPKTSRTWGKNIASSIGNVTRDIVAEVMPNTVSTMSSVASSGKGVLDSLSRSSQSITRQISVLDRSQSSRKTKGMFKRAMDDIREGNLYYKDTANELSFLSESFDSEDFESPTDSQDNFSAAYSATDSVKAITSLNSTMAATSSATISGIGRMADMISGTQLKSTEALSATFKNVSIAQSNIISEGLNQVAKQIQISNQYSAAMLEFMNKNISPTNQSMLDVMPLIGQKLDQIASTLSGSGGRTDRGYRSPNDPMNSIFAEGSGLNFGSLMKQVKNNFQNSGVGQYLGLFQMMTGIGTGGGIGNVARTTAKSLTPMLTKQLAKSVFGKDNLDRIGNLDETVHNAVKEALYSLGDLKDPNIRSRSKTNRLINFFSDILGVERPKLTKLQLGGGRRDENMQWNAIAQKTLVDVIPGFLSSIDKAVNGNQYAKHYDYRSGRFMSEEELGRRYGQEVRKLMDDTFSRATTKVLDSLAGTGIRFSEKDVDKIIGALNSQIDGRINGIEGNTKEYRAEMQSILASNGMATDKIAEVLSTLEKGINNAITQMSKFNHDINMGNYDSQAYRNMMAGSSNWGRDFHNHATTRSYSAINKGAYQVALSDAGIVPMEWLWDMGKKFMSDGRKPANAPRGAGAFFGGAADTASRAIQNFAINAEPTPDQMARYQTRSAAKAADSAHAINKKKDRYNKISKRNLSNFKTGSLDSQVLAQNIAIEEAYLSSEPTDIMQGLAQDIHNNLLVPMYGTFFSKNGILNKFFGDDPNSEFNKLKEKLFGDEGLFKPMSDWLKYKFTGKGYTAKDGTVYEDTDDNVLNKLKGTYGHVYDNTMIYLLGEDYKDQEIYTDFLHGLSPEGIAQRRAQKRAKKEIIKRDAEKWAEERESRKLADQEIGKGYRNRSSIGYGFSQYDPRWANKSTGRYSDGRIATMASAGCGPVALANVANYLGYGVDPIETLGIAKRDGFLSNGGATENLFTRGASRLGLNGKVVSFVDAIKSLKKGMPVIFAGKKKGKASIYSKEGHIITAYQATDGEVLVNDGDNEYMVPYEAIRSGMTHAFTFGRKKKLLPIGGALDIDDTGRQFLRDRAKYSEETINMIDYLRAIGIDGIGYDELDKRLKKKTRKPADPNKKATKHVYDDALSDIVYQLTKVNMTLESMESQYVHNPSYLNEIKQILDKKIPDMNKVFTGLADTFNMGIENLRWALDGSAAEQRDSMTQIQDIIQKITSDQADLANENVKAAIGSDIKDLTEMLTRYMQAMPQQPSYLQQSDYAEAREIIGSLTSQIEDIAKNIGSINNEENLKAIINTIATMNNTQLKSAIATTLDPTKRGIIDPASLFVDIEAETAARSAFVQKETEKYEAVFSSIPTESEEKGSAEVKAKEAIEEHVETIEKSMEKQAESAEKTAKTVEEMEEVMEDLSEDPKSFRTKFEKGFGKFKDKLSKHSTSHLHTAVLGAGVGLLNGMGGGLLTNLFLPGGPIGGAVLGLAGSIIGHSDTMNKILYGETDAEGHFHEGLTTKKAMGELNAKFKKALPYALGGATLGVVKNVVGSLFGLSLGGAPGFIGKALLGTGPMGAAIVGMSIGLLKNSDTIKQMLFGTKEDDGKHYGGKLSGALNKMTDVVKASSGYLKTGIKGAGFGALSGLALSSMGYLPAALAVGGPIGMAVAGLAVGIASNTDRFKRYLFGTESVDEDGNFHKNKDGFLHRAGQAILQDAIYPMKDMMAEKLMDFGMWAKKNVELPFKIAFGPLVDKLKDIKKDIVDVVHDTFDKVGKGVLGFFKGGVEKALTPVSWALRKGADLASSAVLGELKLMGTVLMSPIKMLAKHNMKRGAYKEYDKDYRDTIRDHAALKWQAEDEAGVWEGKKFAGIRRGWSHFKDAFGFGGFVDPEMEALARSTYGKGMDEGEQNSLKYFEANAKYGAAEAKYKSEKERRQKFKKATELARQWSREDKYNESKQWTKALLDERYSQLKELGFDDKTIRSESEIKNLMYHRGDWQGKWGKYGDEDLRVEEVKLQQETAEKTENYQNTMTDSMRAILDILMGRGYQKALDMTHGKRIERSRAERDKIFTEAIKNGADISDFADEMTMTREEYRDAQNQYAQDFKAMENMSYDERLQYVKDKGLPRYVASMVDDSVKPTAGKSNILDFGSFMKKADSSAEVKQSVVESVVGNIQNKELQSAAASALGIDLSDDTEFVKAKMSKRDIRSAIERLNAGVREKDSSVDVVAADGKGKIDVNKFIDVALQNGLIDQAQADEVRGSFKRSKTVSQKTLNTHLKDVLFEAMDEALDKNLDAYDNEQDSEEAEKEKRQKEIDQSKAAQGLGDKQGEKVSMHSWLYEKLFYNSKGEERGGIAGWAKKKVDKTRDSSFFKTMGAILSNPVAQIGLGLGAYFFSDQLIGFADKVSDVWQEHIPALWNFVTTNVVPAVLSKVGDVASFCVQMLPGIFEGIGKGLWALVKDVGVKLGFGNRDKTFGADQVDLAAGTSLNGDVLVQYTDPVTGETSYVMNDEGEYMTLNDYQYLSEDGTVNNISKGVGGMALKGLYRSMVSPRTAKAMLKTTGAAIRIPSAIGKHIPIVGNVFRATDAAGKGLMNASKAIGKNGGKGALTDWMMGSKARYAANVVDLEKWNNNQALKKKLKSNIKSSRAAAGTHKGLTSVAPNATKYADEAAESTLRTVDKIFTKLGKSFKKVSKFVDEHSFTKWIKYFKDLATGGLKKLKASKIAKLGAKLGSAAGKVLDDFVPFLNVAITAYDAIKGWCDAEYLFDVPSGTEDGCMKTVSSVMNTLLGLGIGPLIDILLVFLSDAMGYDIKKDIAQKLYVFLMELSGQDDNLERWEENKAVLEAEVAAYNAAHPTAELTKDEYQALKKEANSGWNKAKNIFGGGIKEDFSKYEEAAKQFNADRNTWGVVRADGSTTVINQYMITDPNALETSSSVGNGRGPIGYGFSQSDPRWADYKLGKFANGKTATMDLAGCGPTALANVASQLSGSNVSPVQVAAMAKRKGYLTHGGANEALFDNGVEAFGLSSKRVGNSEIISHLNNGEKIIVSGKSTSIGYGRTPFTPAGHIITLEGMVGKNVIISDPQDGTSHIQSLSSLTPELTHAWAFSNKGKNTVLSMDNGLVGYGELQDYVDSNRIAKRYTADVVASYFRTYKSDTDGDKTYSGDYHSFTRQAWYPDWNTDRFKNFRGTLNPNYMPHMTPEHFDMTFEYGLNNLKNVISQIDETSYSLMSNWFGSLTESQRQAYFAKWYQDAAFKPESISEEDKLKGGNYSTYQTLMDYYFFPRYALDNGYTIEQVSNAQIMRGWSPKMTGYLYDPMTKSVVEMTESKTVTTPDAIKSVSDDIVSGVSWNGMQVNGYNDINSYWSMPVSSFLALSDVTKGGDPSVKQYWLYRYLWHILDNGVKTNTISEYSIIGEDFLQNIGATTGRDLASAAGINIAMNDYTVNSDRPYGLVNGIPYFSQTDERWSSLMWKNSPFAASGDEIASLAMILSAYSNNGATNRAITPLYMMQNWFTDEHPEWWDKSGFKSDFFSSKGIQSLKETFDASDSPLRLEKLNSADQALTAMKNNKLILMKGRIKNGLFDRTGSHTLVGTYANDGAFILTDPLVKGKGSEIILPNYMLNKLFQSGIVFSKSNGEGLGNIADRNFMEPEKSSSLWEGILETTKNEFLAPIAQFTSGIAAIIGNFAKSLFSGKQYQSIFDTTYDSDESGQIAEEDLDEYDYLSSGMKLYDDEDAAQDALKKSLTTYFSDVGSGDKEAFVNALIEYEENKINPFKSSLTPSYASMYLERNSTASILNLANRNSSSLIAPSNQPPIGVTVLGGNATTSTSQGSALGVNINPTSTQSGNGRSGGGRPGAGSRSFNTGTGRASIGSGGGSGGEYDFIDQVGARLDKIFETVFGYKSGSGNTDIDIEMAGIDTADTSNLNYTGSLTAPGLVAHARKMKRLGTRYVWGGSCERFTEKYRDQLYQNCGDRNHGQKYYLEKYEKFAGDYVSDCSGLIRGYTKKSYNAHGLYSNSTQSGTIDTVPNAPGYLVFRKSKSSDRMEHVGITTGKGYVIHIAGHKELEDSDVVEEKISSSSGNWTHWGKCHLLDYGTVGYGPLKSAAFDASVRNLDLIGYGTGNAVNYLTKTLGGQITQRVGYGIDPSTGNLVRHRGTDIAANYGTPIHSPVSGKVVESKSAGYGSAYGNYTVIKDNRGSKHLFAHMDRPTGYGVGSTVHSGDVIGNVGNSGYSTGPHLHYEVRNNDHIIDPLNHKTNLNVIESRFDDAMRKTSSPTGGENDIVKLASSLGVTATNTDEIVSVLRKIADLLSVWQGSDEESKAAMIDALENSSINTSNTIANLVSNSSSGGNNKMSVSSTSSDKNDDIISAGGRSLFNLIAAKN